VLAAMASGRAKLLRVLAYDLEHPHQVRERRRKYEQSAAGRAAHRRYYTSAKGRTTGAAYKRHRRACIKNGTWSPL
jgi:hypothetical protein